MENSTSITLNFGKHSGKSLQQIATEDIDYIIWIAKYYDIYAFQSSNRFARLKQSTIDSRIALKNEAKQLANNHFESIKEKNQQTSKSEFIGTLRKRDKFTFRVIRKNFEKLYLLDENENQAMIYDHWNLNEGDAIQVIGTPTKHYERMGIKTTYLNRVKISTI